MIHYFDTDLAREIGIEESIIFMNIGFWVKKNEANDKNNYDGSYWTYNSSSAFLQQFPYMTERKIRYALSNLEDKGLIKTGIYNKSAFDKTKWYSLTKLGDSIFQNCNLDVTKLSDRSDKNVRPIPYIKPDSKPDNKLFKENGKKSPKKDECHEWASKYGFDSDNTLLDAFVEFYNMRKTIKKPLSDRATKMLKTKLDDLSKGDIKVKVAILNQSIFNCWQGIFALKDESFLRTEKPTEEVVEQETTPEVDFDNMSDEEFSEWVNSYALRSQRIGHT